MNIFRTFLVPAAFVQLARATALALSPGGVGMFDVPCGAAYVPNMDLPPGGRRREQAAYAPEVTHYLSSGIVDSQFVDLLANPVQLHTLAQVGTVEDVTAMVAASDVTDEPASVLLARHGLQITGRH